MSRRELDGVQLVQLAPTTSSSYRLEAVVAGRRLRGRCSALGRWHFLLARAEWHRGGRRLAVIARAESEAAMRSRIGRELRSYDAGDLVVFEVQR